MKIVLSIAGFDPSGGAGITADLQTFAAHGLYGTSAITALTVQSTRGVVASEPVSPGLLRSTLDVLVADLPPAGVKVGMLGGGPAVAVVGRFLGSCRPQRGAVTVFDPVLRSSSGHELFPAHEMELLHRAVLPHIDWVTPNWAELALLTGCSVETAAQAGDAMEQLGRRHAKLNIVATGGDQHDPIDLLRLATGEVHALVGARVETTSTHGTGCAYSSALLCRLIDGLDPLAAATAAKRFVEGALRHAPGLGGGRGPMYLLWPLREPVGTRNMSVHPEDAE